VEGAEVELLVMRPADRADPPRDPATGRPGVALSQTELAALLGSAEAQSRSVIGA
jgi:hypothetical protein